VGAFKQDRHRVAGRNDPATAAGIQGKGGRVQTELGIQLQLRVATRAKQTVDSTLAGTALSSLFLLGENLLYALLPPPATHLKPAVEGGYAIAASGGEDTEISFLHIPVMACITKYVPMPIPAIIMMIWRAIAWFFCALCLRSCGLIGLSDCSGMISSA